MNKNKLTQVLNEVASHQAKAGNWYFSTFGDFSLQIATCCMEWESGVDNPSSSCHQPNVPHFSIMCSPRFNPERGPSKGGRLTDEHWAWFDWNRNGSTDVNDILYIKEHWGETFRPANDDGWHGP